MAREDADLVAADLRARIVTLLPPSTSTATPAN
jgi:hypothetical protein